MKEITSVPAKAMLVQSSLLPTPPKDSVVLDNACGGGVVTSHLFGAISKTTDVRVVCGDFEKYMANSSTERIKKNRWNAEATVADAQVCLTSKFNLNTVIFQALPFSDNYFSHSLMNFGIQVIPDAALVVKGKDVFITPHIELYLIICLSPASSIPVENWA
jgi:ubiquinone/menaquinone biosynthesis C-methylase UbiE